MKKGPANMHIHESGGEAWKFGAKSSYQRLNGLSPLICRPFLARPSLCYTCEMVSRRQLCVLSLCFSDKLRH